MELNKKELNLIIEFLANMPTGNNWIYRDDVNLKKNKLELAENHDINAGYYDWLDVTLEANGKLTEKNNFDNLENFRNYLVSEFQW